MNYYELARVNQALFAELEALTVEIAYCRDKQIENDVGYLAEQKERIRELIDDNLDKIEDIWQTELLTYRKALRKREEMVPGEIEKRIIELFIDNPDKPMKWISDQANVPISSVSNILTNYLNFNYDRAALNEQLHTNGEIKEGKTPAHA